MDEESSKICIDVENNYVMDKETYTAYNEELNIKKAVEDVKKHVQYDYIIINDSII